jgi:DNA-binding CsgD family transcriptional regulator
MPWQSLGDLPPGLVWEKRRVREKCNNVRRAGSHPGNPPPRLEALLAPPNPGEDFLTGAEWVTMANAAKLTTREIVVATLLLKGRTRKSIAHRLKVSPETVRVHIDRLFEKLRVQDRLGLGLRIARIREAFRLGSAANPERGLSPTKMRWQWPSHSVRLPSCRSGRRLR